ncbi:hypothetical protein GMD78_03340 [Ornithinibacillus sp. L9]|uniref:Uncharacterized protein n=1 Tax=Ornithinibacillus caprae TaxID=2678566 RepID=A0A6N8FGN9_9BACI|nr:hypothetical protein [Ornithinibacillus caprae]MUK87434.1 hypothetical protein [Ornithinibacillus caprae]
MKTHIGISDKEDKLITNQTHFLPIGRIKRVQYLPEDLLVDKQKSVIKGVLFGGFLLG